jgi:hypothetical protein
VVEPYRASGLVRWRKAVVDLCKVDLAELRWLIIIGWEESLRVQNARIASSIRMAARSNIRSRPFAAMI